MFLYRRGCDPEAQHSSQSCGVPLPLSAFRMGTLQPALLASNPNNSSSNGAAVTAARGLQQQPSASSTLMSQTQTLMATSPLQHASPQSRRPLLLATALQLPPSLLLPPRSLLLLLPRSLLLLLLARARSFGRGRSLTCRDRLGRHQRRWVWLAGLSDRMAGWLAGWHVVAYVHLVG